MTDARLRVLERRAADDVESEARLLAERLRIGRVQQKRVELLAYVGDPAARLVLGRTMQHLACSCGGVDQTHGHGEVRWAPISDWSFRLERWGRVACAVAALGASRAAYAKWRETDEAASRCPHCEGGRARCGRCSFESCTVECDRCGGSGRMFDPESQAASAIRETLDAVEECIDALSRRSAHDALSSAVLSAVLSAVRTHGVEAPWVRLVARLCYLCYWRTSVDLGRTVRDALESSERLIGADGVRRAVLLAIRSRDGVGEPNDESEVGESEVGCDVCDWTGVVSPPGGCGGYDDRTLCRCAI